MTTVYEKYAQAAHLNSKSKGFWENPASKNKGEMIMLMISELGECQEANRKDKRLASRDKEITSWIARQEGYISTEQYDPTMFSPWFLACVKDTEGDELADTAIRLMDYCWGWEIRPIRRDYRKSSTDNFSYDLLRIVGHIIQAFDDTTPGKDWGYVWSSLISFADWWDIDLVWHIEQKMAYNATRPYKHNKSY